MVCLFTYKSSVEEKFRESRRAPPTTSCVGIIQEIVKDYKFWRFMLFSFVIVGAKMVFSLLFFMIPKMIT